MSGQTDRFRVLRRLPEIRFEDELRGYSKSQVDRVLETLAPLADEVEALQSRLSEAETRAASAEARLVEQTDRVDSISEPAPAPDAAPAPQTPADFDETLRNTLLLAQRTADQTVRDATQQAEQIRSDANAEVEGLVAAGQREADELRAQNEADRAQLDAELVAERTERLEAIRADADERLARIEAELTEAHEGQRQALLDQIAELEQHRDLLSADVERFEAHLADRREAVRLALGELEQLVEGDVGLRGEMPPVTSDGPAINPDDFGPITVESAAAADLAAELDDGYSDSSDPTASDDGASDAGAVSGIMLGEVDPAGPAPEGDGPPTEAIDVMALIDDAESASTEEPISALEADEDTADPVVEEVLESGEPAEAKLTWRDGPPREEGPDASLPVRAPGVTLDQEIEAAGAGMQAPATAETPVADGLADVAGDDEAGDDVVVDDMAVDDIVERPSWADDVPEAEPVSSQDPFLDELRRVTNDESADADDDALSRFLEDTAPDDGDKGGWFGRRRT